MTYPNSTTQSNSRTRADAAAERYQERQPRRQPSPWAKFKPWLLAGLLGLALGAGTVGAATFGQPPLPGSHAVRNALVTLPDGQSGFLVSGWVVYLPAPKAPGQP